LSNPSTPELTAAYHSSSSSPADDEKTIGPAIAAFTARLSARANLTTDAELHGKWVAAMLCPSLLSYEIGTPAEFSMEKVNGRYLTDDAYDVILSLATNTVVKDGVAPNISRTRPDGEPFNSHEQPGLQPIQANIGYRAESSSP
jgi:hypothetical protein